MRLYNPLLSISFSDALKARSYLLVSALVSEENLFVLFMCEFFDVACTVHLEAGVSGIELSNKKKKRFFFLGYLAVVQARSDSEENVR